MAPWRWQGRVLSGQLLGRRQGCAHLLPKPSRELRVALVYGNRTGSESLEVPARPTPTLPSQLSCLAAPPPPFLGEEVAPLVTHLQYFSPISAIIKAKDTAPDRLPFPASP
jgi:hypothetical protein